MVNYVNTVLVSNLSSGELFAVDSSNSVYAPSTTDAGKFIIMNCDEGVSSNKLYDVTSSNANTIQTIKVGYITDRVTTLRKPDGTTEQIPLIKWSNEIKAADIKSYQYQSYAADTEDVAYIDLSSLTDIVGGGNSAEAGKRIIVRLTYKDMPHRYRKWTESYEYVTVAGDTKATITSGIVNMINGDWKRARVNATAGSILDTTDNNYSAGANDIAISGNDVFRAGSGTVIKIEGLPYDDDDSVDSINWANKVRFNVNMYWTDPAADGWESLNKKFLKGATIKKIPGKQYIASAKYVRDREAWGMGYQGILNRGEGTWPIIRPAMVTDLTKHYNAITLEFENMYRAADDIQRKTKQTLEVYGVSTSGIKAALDAFVA